MIKALRRIEEKELYHYKNGVKIMGKNPRMSGFLTGLWGDCTDAWGNEISDYSQNLLSFDNKNDGVNDVI